MSDRRPTILQLIPRLDTGGAELSTIEIVEAIVRSGGRALVATEGGRLADRITESGGEIVPFRAASKNPLRIIANAGRLQQLIAAEGIDLLHARSRAPAWSALMAARRSKIPFVTTYHGAYGESGRLKRLYNSVMVRADKVIANSNYTAGLIRSRYGTPEDRLTVIHRGVDLAAFDPAAVSAARIAVLRRAWGIADGRLIVLQAARLTDWKGQRVTVAAAARLKQEGRLGAAAIVLAGDAQGRDGYTDALRRDIRAAGLDGVVVMPGHVADMAAAFAAAHVTVIASTKEEAFGRTATEAQAMGCPVIATDLGAPRETVVTATDRATGWLVPPGDPQPLAERISTALTLDASRRAVMGAHARANVAARFTVTAMQRATLAVYDQLLGTKQCERFPAATD